MRFFTDHNIPEVRSKLLESSRLRGRFACGNKSAPNSPDNLVAAIAQANDAVLITMDSDFKSLASRTGIGQRGFRQLSLIRFERCRESHAAVRLERALSLIEHEWLKGNGPNDRRMFVVITEQTIRTHR